MLSYFQYIPNSNSIESEYNLIENILRFDFMLLIVVKYIKYVICHPRQNLSFTTLS